MAGKILNQKVKKVSHGNSHASSEDVKWDEINREWVFYRKEIGEIKL